MRRTLSSLPILLLALAFAACADSVTEPRMDALGPPGAPSLIGGGGDGVVEPVPVPVVPFGQPDGPELGWSKIQRSPDGIKVWIHSRDLTPGHAVTIWAVVFNRPEECSPEPSIAIAVDGPDNGQGPPSCGEDDLFGVEGTVPSPADADILWVSGADVGDSGMVWFPVNTVRTGDPTESIFHKLGFPVSGLTNPMGAEVHLIVRTHGPWMNDLFNWDMFSTFAGGCEDPFDSGGLLGREGPNTCEDIQMSIHFPPPSVD